MAVTVTRAMVNSLSSSIAGGSIPSGLVIRDVPDFIPYVRRSDTPMLSLVPKRGEKDILKWEYGQGDLSPRADAINNGAGYTNVAASIVVDNGAYFQLWDQVRVPRTGEVLLVTGISGNTLTVTRGWGSTNGAALVDNDPLKIMGPAVPEGVNAPDSPVTRGELFFTYPQILEYTWTLTHRARVTPNYEMKSDAYKEETKRKMKEAAEDLNDLLLNGIKNEGDGAGTNPSSMGGLREHTAVYATDLAGTALDLGDILDQANTVFLDVGMADMAKTIMGNARAKRIFNSFFQPARRASMSDAKMKLTWDQVDTDYGTLKFVVNHLMDDGELIVWNPQDSGLYNYKGGNWSTGMYATQGWYDKGFLRGDFGAIFEGERRRFRIYNFSTASADYPNLDVAA